MNDNDDFMTDAKSDLQADLNALPPGRATMDRVVHSAHAAVDRLAELAVPRVQRVQSGVAHASNSLREQADAARATGDRWTENLRDGVRDKPLTALATALVVGLVLARLS